MLLLLNRHSLVLPHISAQSLHHDRFRTACTAGLSHHATLCSKVDLSDCLGQGSAEAALVC